jgi:hypothetical protein
MAMEKEALTHKIEDDLAARNRNWDKVETHLADYATEMPKKANKQQEGWTYPTLVNGWQNVSGSRPTRYFVDEFGIAHIFCEISGGATATNTELFRLGNRYAPEFYTFFSCIHNNNEARLLSLRPGSGGFFIESGITGTIRFTLSIPVIPL